jgi:putative oxidoreductase
MNAIQRLEHWGDTHHPAWVDILRIGLGVFLFAKGILFASNLSGLIGVMDDRPALAFAAGGVAHYIIMAHLMGGIMIGLGLLTRWAIIINIPILLGALFFVNISRGYYGSELWLSLVVLVLLVVFLILGSGRFSLDEFMKNHPGK